MPASSLNIGWEANPLLNSGANIYTYLTRSITITGFQISVSMAPAADSWGICELLACASIGLPGQRLSFSAELPRYPAFSPFPANPDFMPSVVASAPDVGVAGFVGYSGYLFSTILKSVRPDAINQCIWRDGLNLQVPAASCLVFHMDHAGGVATDCEMQGVLNYV